MEARCKGSTRHYPGKIFMDNRDGTYDVKFDDGDRDRMVPKRSIKKLGGGGAKKRGVNDDSDADGGALREGDEVDGLYYTDVPPIGFAHNASDGRAWRCRNAFTLYVGALYTVTSFSTVIAPIVS